MITLLYQEMFSVFLRRTLGYGLQLMIMAKKDLMQKRGFDTAASPERLEACQAA